jgi:hypothetical protein
VIVCSKLLANHAGTPDTGARSITTVAATCGVSSEVGGAASATEGTSSATASDEQALTVAWY